MNSYNNNKSIEKFVRDNTVMIAEENAKRNCAEMFKCIDCNKGFDSFHSLCGHRSDHRSARRRLKQRPTTKSHACKICKKEFERGQSLGGHMKKHYRLKEAVNNKYERSVLTVTTNSFASSSSNLVSIKIEIDLNLTPAENEKANDGKSGCN